MYQMVSDGFIVPWQPWNRDLLRGSCFALLLCMDASPGLRREALGWDSEAAPWHNLGTALAVYEATVPGHTRSKFLHFRLFVSRYQKCDGHMFYTAHAAPGPQKDCFRSCTTRVTFHNTWGVRITCNRSACTARCTSHLGGRLHARDCAQTERDTGRRRLALS